MRKRIAAALLTSGAAALIIGFGAPQALAATWTVSPGGSITGSAGSAHVLEDTTAQVGFATCRSNVGGVLKAGTGLAGRGIGKITSLAFSNCLAGTNVTTSASTANPWLLNAGSYNATTGVTHATITNIVISWNNSSAGCSLTVAGATATTPGTVKVSYTNSTDKLNVNHTGGTLHIWNISSGCSGLLLHDGDSVQLRGTYTITPGQTITSP